ncbi:MAG: HEPN domain-containing protein, partial [bacterium]
MNKELKELIEYRLERSKETFQEAELLFNNKHFHAVMNRCYYSAFYAVSALLLILDKSSSKHSGIRALFNQYIINQDLIEEKWANYYNKLFDKRQTYDYVDFSKVDESLAETYLTQT